MMKTTRIDSAKAAERLKVSGDFQSTIRRLSDTSRWRLQRARLIKQKPSAGRDDRAKSWSSSWELFLALMAAFTPFGAAFALRGVPCACFADSGIERGFSPKSSPDKQKGPLLSPGPFCLLRRKSPGPLLRRIYKTSMRRIYMTFFLSMSSS